MDYSTLEMEWQNIILAIAKTLAGLANPETKLTAKLMCLTLLCIKVGTY